jgi:hypothetical protein
MCADRSLVSSAVPLHGLRTLSWSTTRRGEPATIGLPLPAGLAMHPSEVGLRRSAVAAPVQVRPLDRWPDQSLRWVLLTFLADVEAGTPAEYALVFGRDALPAPAGPTVSVQEAGEGSVQVASGRTIFRFLRGRGFPFDEVGQDRSSRPAARLAVRIGHAGRQWPVSVERIVVHDAGPLRCEIEVHGALPADAGSLPLRVVAMVEIVAGLPSARVDLTLRNPRRARHRRGEWSLGDPGSVLLDSAVVDVDLGGGIEDVRCAAEWGQPLEARRVPFEIHQESSGGEHWNGPIHRNRAGEVPLRFRGYRLTSGTSVREGLRASPIVTADCSNASVAVAVPDFWENFPRAISVLDTAIHIGVYPWQAGDRHELQGGEQKTHRFALSFGTDPVSDPPLAWVHDPVLLYPSPDWIVATGVVPEAADRPASRPEPYATIVNTALDATDGFLAKREAADEYGWRHFGDLPADHESAFHPPDRPLVSHYNNQYDAIAAFAIHFLASGDARWWRLMTDLARHVRDIDIYHTTEDRSAYNGGLFWHTAHYLDAGLSTHRTYPPGAGLGGGPSAEHNYNAGLMLHFFLTGERASREAAIDLGAWVIRMDDGRRTPFRWLAAGATGLASLTRDYHGPGRGAGHSILACLVAGRLTGDPVYHAKAEELIARCIHPRDDITARGLTDVERRWSYTVFLQALGAYLQDRDERGEHGPCYAHARDSLLHYARWLAAHEVPYLSRPELLEFPTETWAAQDLRKADALLAAARHAGPGDRAVFLERARFFFTYATSTLGGLPERRFTRPLVLALGQAPRVSAALHAGAPLRALGPVPRSAERALGRPASFIPQKKRAMRRAAVLAGLGLAAGGLLLARLLSA